MTTIYVAVNCSSLNSTRTKMDRFKESFPFPTAAPIAILGVPFDNVSTAETLRIIDDMVASRRPHYLVTANVDFLVQAAQDVELRRILFDAHLVLCDGTPLVWASKLLGNPLPERVAGSDLVPLLLGVAAEKGYRPFFLGASPDSMEAAVAKAKQQYPKLDFAGYYSPPFNKLLEMDHEEIRDRIMRAKPDLLFVGFGCPKQEKWINMHYRSLGVPVSIGVGGTIDFLAGRLARAPRWMQKSGTEWIFRLAQEPKRLLRRYAKDLWHFTGAIAAQCWRLRRRARRNRSSQSAPPEARTTSSVPFQVLTVPSRLDFEEVHRIRAEMEATLLSPTPVVLDLNQVEFIDSTGVGLLIRMQKRARCDGHQLVLTNISENVRRALELMRLHDFFIVAPNLAAAEALFTETANTSVQLRSHPSSPFPALFWSGELTAANAESFWISTIDHIAARSLVQRSLLIDLANLTFVDSTGLGVMIRIRKYGTRQGIKVDFSSPTPNVQNVIRLARLEEYLMQTKE